MQLTKKPLGTTLLGFSSIGFALPLYLLLLSGFPTVDGFKVCAMIFVQIVSGSIIWAHVMHPRQVDIVEGVGMGLALGSILTVIGHQLLLPTALNAFGWLLPVAVAAIVFITSSSTKGSFKNFVLGDVSGLFFVAFTVVLMLKQWWWLLPLSLPIGLALYLLSNSGKNKLLNFVRPAWLVIAATFIAATFLAVYLRQLNLDWWVRSWDLPYFESRSYSLAKFGRNENISLVGYPIHYHWFGLAWLGSATIITNLGPWLAITQVAPVYSVISIGCLILAIAKRTSSNQFTKYAILLPLGLSASVFSTSNTSNISSFIWFFAAIIVADEFFAKRRTNVFVIFGVIALATLTTKLSAGFTLLSAFSLTDIWINLKSIAKIRNAIFRIIALVLGTIASYFIVFGGPNRLGDDFIKLSLKGPAYWFGVDPGRESAIFVIGFLGFMLTLVPFSIGIFSSSTQIRRLQPIVLFSTFGFLSLILPSLFASHNLGYFILSALIIALIGSAIVLTSTEVVAGYSAVPSSAKLTFFVLAVLAAQAKQFLYELNWREISTLRGGPVPILVLVVLSYYLISFAAGFIFTRRHRVTIGNSRIRAKFATFAIFLLIGSLAPPIVEKFRLLPSQAINSDEKPPPVGSSEVSAASEWLNINSTIDQIVATNRFCTDSATPVCPFPKYYGISTTTRRRLLIEGPFYVLGYGGEDFSSYPEFAKERLDLSRGFADNPTLEITARLRELGVDWFYLFLDNTENRNWQPFATVEYQNSEVAILKLADPNP